MDAEKFGRAMESFIGKMLGQATKGLDEAQARYDEAKVRLDAGDESGVFALWEDLSASLSKGEMVADTYVVRVGQLWGEHLAACNRFEEAQGVFERALEARAGLVTERFKVLFLLADALWAQDKGDEAQTLLREHPLCAQIERAARVFPGSDTGARLARSRFDFAEEARLLRRAFEPSPMMPESLAQTLRVATGSDEKRWREIAMAHFNAGEISLAIEARERALAVATTTLQKVGALCLIAMWRRSREGWEAVEPLLAEAQALASDDFKAQASILRMHRMRAQERADWQGWQVVQDVLRARMPNNMTTETADADISILRGNWAEGRAALDAMRGAFLSSKEQSAFRARTFPVLTRAFLELRAFYCGEENELPEAHAELRAASVRLRGDLRMETLSNLTLAAMNAALGQESAALELASALELQWESWSDDVSTQTSFCTFLGGTYFYLGRLAEAIVWLQRGQELEQRLAYRVSGLETLARAHEKSGQSERARELWREVAASGLEIKAVELARRALDF